MVNNKDLLEGKKNIHFIGIGGSGMLPLVQILYSEGFNITGSDNNETDTLNLARQFCSDVYIGQSAQNIKDVDLIVYSAAIMNDNPELIAARDSGILTVQRSVLLGCISARYQNAICISGTHGKTTTSAMATQILLDKFDPTVVIGGKLNAIGGNGRSGKSDIMVCEACEFVDTFLKLSTDISVILNIDEDHLDYFKTMDNLIASFNKFAKNTTKQLIINGDDANTLKALSDITTNITTFGFNISNDYYPQNIVIHKGIHTTYNLFNMGKDLGEIDLYVPGKHNILNSIAAAISAFDVGATFADIKDGLANFKGAGRRFEQLGTYNGATIIDDYAHHPLEIKVTLQTAKTMGFNRIIAVHQPFTYSRTARHLSYFADALSIADKVILSEIMGSREKNTYNIFAKDLCNKIDGAIWFNTFDEIVEHLKNIIKPNDLVITMGCGDIYKVAHLLLQ